MKFDAERAMGWVDTFAASERAVAEAAEPLTTQGYRVERDVVTGVRTDAVAFAKMDIPWFGFALVYLLVPLAHFGRGFAASLAARLVWMAAGPAWLVLSPRVLVPVIRALAARGQSEHVEIHRSSNVEPPRRVVFVTATDAPRPILPRSYLGFARGTVVITSLVLVAMMLIIPGPQTEARRVELLRSVAWAELAFTAAVSAYLLRRRHFRPASGAADNGDGLATLLAMARGWSREADQQIETRFVAAGGQTLDLAGLRRLVGQIRAVWPQKPTLVVGLWSPGLGKRLAIVSPWPPLGTLATSAAAGLWLPYRVEDDPVIWSDLWPFGERDPEFVGLIGSADGEPSAIDPEAMKHAAQLAAEIALRWAKSPALSDQEGDDNRDRSSQNPG